MKHIFYVDDDIDDIEVFKMAAENTNAALQVSTSTHPEQVLENLNEISLPDVILLDVNMPLFNGYECLEKIRAVSKYQKIPAVLYSTSKLPVEIIPGDNDGPIHFQQKGSDMSEIVGFISDLSKGILPGKTNK